MEPVTQQVVGYRIPMTVSDVKRVNRKWFVRFADSWEWLCFGPVEYDVADEPMNQPFDKGDFVDVIFRRRG